MLMHYLQQEWSHYSDRHGLRRVVLVSLSILEDALRFLHLPYEAFRPIWFLRGRLTEGKTRRLLRKVVKHWRKSGIYEQNYFDCGDRALVITFEWKDISIMKGVRNEIQ